MFCVCYIETNTIENMKTKKTRTSIHSHIKKKTSLQSARRKKSANAAYSAEQAQLLLESVQEYAIFMLDPNGFIKSWNSGAQRMKGYRKEEIIGKHFSLFYSQEDRQSGKPDDLLHRAKEQGHVEDEGWRVRKDGSRFWANVMITPLWSSTHQLLGFSKITRDLSERKETEHRLQEIIDRSPSIFFAKDLNGRYMKINSQFEKLFGLTAADVIGKTDHEIFPKEQADEFSANDQKVLESGEPITFEEHARYFDGVHTSIVQKYPLRRLDGSIYGIGGIVTDITMIKKITTELLETTSKLQAVIQASPLAILTINEDGVVMSWNKGAERIFGWTEEEAVGHRLKIVPQDSLNDYLAMVQRGLNGESASVFIRTLQKKNGTVMTVSISYAPAKNDSGTTENIVVIIEDITERINTEEKLHQSHHQLRSLTRELQKTREEERSNLVKEINDKFGQLLAEISTELKMLHQNIQLQKITSLTEVLSEIRMVSNKANESLFLVRDIVKQFRSSALDYLGLIVAMELHIQEFEQSSGVRTTFITNISDVHLSTAQSIAVLNVMRESLSNIHRHADASHAMVKFLRKNSHIVLIIEDDGRGVPNITRDITKPSGISIMEEQARALRGELAVERLKPSGTVVTLTIPLANDTVSGSPTG
jgi:PAS domain S-box-containing protein